MKITALYAGLLAALFLVLSFRTIFHRRAQKVEIGDGGDRELLRRARVHANFAEYVPISLVLIGLAESLAMPALGLHALGVALLGGRLVHAYGLSQSPHNLTMRTVGMMLTLTVVAIAALSCIVLSFAASL